MRLRPTVRLRLTLLYGGLFLGAGSVLLLLNYGLVHTNFPPAPTFREIQPSDVESTIPLGAPEGFEDRTETLLAESAEDFRQATLSELLVQSGIAMGVMAVASVGLGWLIAGRVLRPLKDITTTARRLSEENLHERIALAGPADELKELADTFDAMLARLESAFESQRRFIANASHELRTPLAIEQTVLEVALADPEPTVEKLQAVAQKVYGVSRRNQRLIESLLLLARSNRDVEAPEAVDLAAAASDAVAELQVEIEQRHIHVTMAMEPAWVTGDRALLERMVANLVENAVRHNNNGGWIHISSTTQVPKVHLRVANSGPQLPADAVESLFEPFRRFSSERTASDRGVGLGLSIVNAVVNTHGGQLAAQALDEGGLQVDVMLDAVTPPAVSEPSPEALALPDPD